MLVATVAHDRSTKPTPAIVGVRAALSFEAFYLANEQRLFRALYVMTGQRDEAEDLMQHAFCKVWERWDRVSRLDDPTGYLFRTAFNAHHSATRRAMRATRRLVHRSTLTAVPTTPAEPSELAAVRDTVARALQALTPRQREAVVLTELLGFGGAEAAQIMRIRPATVRVLASQARAALQRSWTGDDT